MKKQKNSFVKLKPAVLLILNKLVRENPHLQSIFKHADTLDEAKNNFKNWIYEYLTDFPYVFETYKHRGNRWKRDIGWKEFAIIRLLDYISYEGMQLNDPNLSNTIVVSQPIENLWRAIRFGKGNCTKAFCLDMLYLFRQMNGKLKQSKPSRKKIISWMSNFKSGMDEDIQSQRKENKERIIRNIIKNIESGKQKSRRFQFQDNSSYQEKYEQINRWWNDYRFHLSFAIRTPDLLNEMMNYSLSDRTLKRLYDARKRGIPLFVNPHYLSLLCISDNSRFDGVDMTIRDYIFPSRKLIQQFGNIEAWEKEDKAYSRSHIPDGSPKKAGE